MRAIDVVGSLSGSVVLYVAMAACGAPAGSGRAGELSTSTGAGGTANGASGAGSQGSGGVLGGLVDAMTNPVADAHAALPPDVATEPCNKRAHIGDSGIDYLYAEHAYPGKTKADLTALRQLGHLTSAYVVLPGYADIAGLGAYVRDGIAAVFCGSSQAPIYDTITFILPN